MTKIIVSILVALFITILALQIDDSVEPNVQSLLNTVKNTETSQAYFYLMGIHANEKDNPLTIGKAVFESIREGQARYIHDGEQFDYEDYPKNLRLEQPDGELFCRLMEDSCLTTLFNQSDKIESLLANNNLLLERYHEFNQLGDYATLSMPMVTEPFPPYHYLATASRLVLLQSILDIIRGEDEQATNRLLENIKQLRTNLAEQDTLLGKLILIIQLSNNLDVLYLAAKNTNSTAPLTISALTKKEKDFAQAIAREFGMAYNTFQYLDGSDNFLSLEGGAPGWAIKTIFKPNMTLNSVFPAYQRAITHSRLTPNEFATQLENKNPLKIEDDNLRNAAGVRLAKSSLPDFDRYIGQIFDLDAKIILFNALVNEKDTSAAIKFTKNPYYPDQSAQLNDSKNSICFDGPKPDNKGIRCIRINL